jgi:hypothetical protein
MNKGSMQNFLKSHSEYWLPAALIAMASSLRMFVCLQHRPAVIECRD